MDDLRAKLRQAFTEHPRQTGETYFQHLGFTVKIALRLAGVSLILVAHGLFPFLFTWTAGAKIGRIHGILCNRMSNAKKVVPMREPLSRPPRIGIVGGGFSGTLMLANLVRQAAAPLVIEWFDENNAFTAGVAYGTQDTAHLLNVRCDGMGAFSADPEGFYTWLQTDDGKAWTARLSPDKPIDAGSFAPRALYAAYLRAIFNETLEIAREKQIEIRAWNDSVTDALAGDAKTGLMLSVGNERHEEVPVDILVLASGNAPPRRFGFRGLAESPERYAGNIWRTDSRSVFPERLDQLATDDTAVIIGTGLTMADCVLTLQKRGFKGNIVAISRHGWLPASHAPAAPYPQWEWVQAPDHAPRNSLGTLRRLRQEIVNAASGHHWRGVIDSLRPVTQKLWQRLDTIEKRKFMRHLFALWNVHRHRMAPEIHAELEMLQRAGKLKILPGRIDDIVADGQALDITYHRRGSGDSEIIRAALVLNCTGPEYDVTAGSTLLRNLCARGLVIPDELGLGIRTTPSGSAEGNAPESIYPVGPLLTGELLETTAVPELREQAAVTAASIINRLFPESAAQAA